MRMPVEAIRAHLTARYREVYGANFAFGRSLGEAADRPTWLSVSTPLLLPSTDGGADAVLVADPDIAVLLYLLPLRAIEDVPTTISRATALRSRLMPITGKVPPKDGGDASWTVVLHWFTESNEDRSTWISRLAHLRADSAQSEEVPVDLIVALDGQWEKALELHGLPRLLLRVRSVLKADNPHQIEKWLSADDALQEALRSFERGFKSEAQRKLARQIRDKFGEIRGDRSVAGDWSPALGLLRKARGIAVKNFRNIEALSLELGQKSVGASVINGPNGTGKSALFEALSLAIGGVSHRYLRFLQDSDVRVKDKASEYVSNYLSRNTGGKRFNPAILVDGEEVKLGLSNDKEQISALSKHIEGSFLSQEQSNEFIRADATELAQAALGDYSIASAHLVAFVEDECARVDAAKQVLLRSIGARANITNRKTAYRRACEQTLTEAMPFSVSELGAWLKAGAEKYPRIFADAEPIAEAWSAWHSSRDSLMDGILDRLSVDRAESHIRSWMTSFNDQVASLESWAQLHNLGALRMSAKDGSELVGHIEEWGVWLEEQGRTKGQTGSQVVQLQEIVRQLEEQQKVLVDRGRLLRVRLDHLTSSANFVESIWVPLNPSDCPTCDTNVSDRGGIASVVSAVKDVVQKEHAESQVAYKVLSENLRINGDQLKALGFRPNPVGVEQQSEIEQLIRAFSEDPVMIEGWLQSAENRLALAQFAAHMASQPTFPQRIQVETVSKTAAERIVRTCDEIDEVFEQPDQWRELLRQLRHLYASVVQAHLPKTTEGLWQEIAFFMTSARWLELGNPSISVETLRGEQTARIEMSRFEGKPLARHILNQAEIHVLGLAWFLVRYLTSGRFQGAVLVLDDPAQEMDQTTYRDFCRLFESLLRLHRRFGRELKVVLMLHQEDRAVDAARALNAPLTILGWTETQSKSFVADVRVLGDAAYWPQPLSVLSQ